LASSMDTVGSGVESEAAPDVPGLQLEVTIFAQALI